MNIIKVNTTYYKNINFNLISFTANGKDTSESPKTEELDDSNEETENGKEDEPVEKMDESTGEETETSEIEKTETSKVEKTEKAEVEETEEKTETAEVEKTEEKTETAKVEKREEKRETSEVEITEEKTETAEVEITDEKETEKDKEIEEKVEKVKTSEKTTEEEESAEADILLASDDEEIKEAKIDDNSKKESEEILSPKSREERAKYKASLPKKGKKNSEVIDKKELENSEPEIETIESDDDAIAEVLETESNNKKKVDTTEVTLVDDTPDDSNSIEEINDETPADSIAQVINCSCQAVIRQSSGSPGTGVVWQSHFKIGQILGKHSNYGLSLKLKCWSLTL